MKNPRASNRPLFVALLALFVWRGSLEAFGGRGQLHEQNPLAVSGLAGNEAIFYVGVLVAQAFFIGGLGLWLARRWQWARLDVVARALVTRRSATLAGITVAGAAAAFGVALLVVHLHSTTEDEKTYVFQAKLLLMHRLWIEVPHEAAPLWEPFIVRPGNRWSGQYFWAQPALLALGLLVHAVYVIPALQVACAVLFTGLLVEELSGDRRAGLFAAALVAISPIVILTGATLLNATLSLACSAVSLWALARLHKGSDRAATWALGLATGLNLNNRAFDQVTLMLAAACVLAVVHFRKPLPILRRLVPAIAITLPFVGAQFLINKEISGDWRQSGYALYYMGQNLIMMGFGKGMGGFTNDVPVALSKTLANAVRMAFYTAGSPFAFAPLAAWAIVGQSRGLLRAGGWIAFLYYGAYLVYASASIQTTGPVYFDALVPVLAGGAALGAVHVHDVARGRESLRSIVPALGVAQMIAALVIFWPPALLELKRSAKDSASCDDLVATLDPVAPALVFVIPGSTHRSWTYWRPMVSPTLDDRILFANMDGVADDTALVAKYGAGRTSYLAHCVSEPNPKIERFDPLTGRAWAIGGK